MTLQEWVTLIKDMVTILAALTAAYVAFVGFRTWEQQLHWKTQYELAQRMAKAVYRVRNAIAEVRRFYTTEDEQEENEEVRAWDDPDEFPPGLKVVYRKRWQKVQEALLELASVSLEAEAIWGAVVKENLQPLMNCVTTLSIAIRIYLDKIEHKLPINMFQENDRDFKIIYDTPGEQDNFFSNEITEAVKKMEVFLKPYLKI